MQRLLRIYLLGCMAIAFAYLLVHVREPLRLNVGDPWSDAEVLSSVASIKQHGFTTDAIDVDLLIGEAYRPTHYPPLAEVVYGAIGKLGIAELGGIAAFRLFALAFSVLAMWLLFSWARRIWGDTVALIATALFSTSALWMMYADGIHRPPGALAACFLALWGLVRAIETPMWRYRVAAIAGSFWCVLAGSGDWILVVAGVLFTIYIKRGNPFARGNRRFVVICAAGGLAAAFTMSLFDFGPVEWQPGVLEWRTSIDDRLVATLATLLRRCTLVLTPMFWITVVYAAWRALRAPSLTSVLQDGMTWLAAVAAIVLYLHAQDAESPILRVQPLLPFSVIGSAILIARLLERGSIRRALAIVWVAAAPAWGLYIMLSHPRSVLDRDDVAKVRAYLETNDRNDFVISNLKADAPLQVAFDRHTWPAFDTDDDINAHPMRLWMLELFEVTGTDYVHAVIFTTPDSRFVDRSLGQILMPRRLASVTGWPYIVRAKANEIVRDYDRKVLKNLGLVGAKQVLHLDNFDVYRIDRSAVIEATGRALPVVRAIDFSSFGSDKYKLLGWGAPKITEEDLGASSIDGHSRCQNPVLERRAGGPAVQGCGTALTRSGLSALDRGFVNRAQLMIRVERACDLRLTLELSSPARVPAITAVVDLVAQLSQLPLKVLPSAPIGIAIHDFTDWQCEAGDRASFLVPARSVRAGVNVITFEKKRDARADVISLAIEPVCDGDRRLEDSPPSAR